MTQWQKVQRLLWAACVALAAIALSTVSAQGLGTTGTITYYQAAETMIGPNVAAQSFYSSMAQCMERGMNLWTAESLARRNRLQIIARATYGSIYNRSTYSTISQMKTATNKICTYERTIEVSASTSSINSRNCFFTQQWGLFTERTLGPVYGSQPGMAAYQCSWLYYRAPSPTSTGRKCGLNFPAWPGLVWDTERENPQGKNFSIIFTGTSAAPSVTFSNIDAVAPDDSSYRKLSEFVSACEAPQYMGAGPAASFTPSQPAFVKAYKELTWVQEHWWVLFLIIAVVILIVLFAILIFCCVTSIPPKEGPPIAPMVLRERNGQAYVNASDDEDSAPKSRGLNLGDANNATASMNDDGQQRPVGQQEMMMMPVPVVDPEDLIQATPSIYSQEDVMQSAEGDSMASEEDDSNLSDERQHH